ncbi:MAG: energy transducer TonB [Deltaproteobacteria bacterium]|nr:energy transducer TonB [Deltaproteobacteria bacterium]MBN2687107.1 energy transducer TonB [Deltaproteobacteria bacterium]
MKRDLIAAFCIAVIVHGIIAVADMSSVRPVVHLKEDTRKFLRLSFVSVVSPPETKVPVRSIAVPPHEPAVVTKRTVRKEAPAVEKKPVEKKEVVREDAKKPIVQGAPTPAVDNVSVASKQAVPAAVSSAPRYEENLPPAYPAIARRRGYEGTVILSVQVDADGLVGGVSVKVSSGHAILDRAAVDAVKRWIFRPGARWGFPVPMTVDVPVRFMLKENGSS